MTPEQLEKAAHAAAAESQRILAAAEAFAVSLDKRGLTTLSAALRASLKHALVGGKKVA
jgi:23S rRNA pseudoU1915 N3-methylase RlmH